MFNDCIKPHSICMRLLLSTQEEFSLKLKRWGGGANVKSVSTYPLSKTQSSSDLVHYFLGGIQNFQLKIKINK